MPGIPRVSIGIVDVRDVALAHVRCIEKEFFQISNGKRYILVEGSYWMEEMLRMLRDEFKQYGYKITEFTVGTFLFNVASIFDKQAALI